MSGSLETQLKTDWAISRGHTTAKTLGSYMHWVLGGTLYYSHSNLKSDTVHLALAAHTCKHLYTACIIQEVTKIHEITVSR